MHLAHRTFAKSTCLLRALGYVKLAHIYNHSAAELRLGRDEVADGNRRSLAAEGERASAAVLEVAVAD